MAASDIERLIRARIPDAEVAIQDLAGDGIITKRPSLPSRFAASHGSSSTRSSTRRSRPKWAAGCTPWRCKPERRSAKAARSERQRRSPGWVIPGIAFSDKPVRRRQGGRSPGHLTMKSEAWALRPFCATYIARRADGIRRGRVFPAAQQGRRECPSISPSTTRSRETRWCCS